MHRFSDLRFVLCEGGSPLGAARILAAREARWNGDVVCFYVLAVSHAVVVGGDGPLTELLTCSDVSIDREPLARARVVGMHEFRTRTGRLSYYCRLEPFSLSVGDELVGPFSPEHRMDIFYPGDERRGAPVTRIGWRIEPASLVVETVHSYPEQEMGVRSRSRFELRHGAA